MLFESKCSNCKFYDEGYCKRYPPLPNYDGEDLICHDYFPRVRKDDWCGEFILEKEVKHDSK